MLIELTPLISVCDSSSLEQIAEATYRVYCVKYPFHKEEVGYSGCCPTVGHPEQHIAYRAGFCSINFLNVETESYLNRTAFELALKQAEALYLSGKAVCFVDNGLDSVAPIMCALLLYKVNLFNVADLGFNELMVFMHGKIPNFRPKEGQLAMANKIFNEINAGR